MKKKVKLCGSEKEKKIKRFPLEINLKSLSLGLTYRGCEGMGGVGRGGIGWGGVRWSNK